VAINEFCDSNNINFVAMNTSDIVKSAINISSPIIMIINAIPIIAAIGAGVMYTQAISLNNRVKADEI
jgi:Na+-driven multidrug efflux pump